MYEVDGQLSSQHLSGYLLLRHFVIYGRVDTPAWQKYLWSGGIEGSSQKPQGLKSVGPS